MKIGITERGDASLDFTWHKKLDSIDGAIIITKNLTDAVIDRLITASKPIILHATCTGWGGTVIEPRIPEYKKQLSQIQKLIDRGFPKENIVLRVDPILPFDISIRINNEIVSINGISVAERVITDAVAMGLLPGLRVRISLLDAYKHTKERLIAATGVNQEIYNGAFQAPAGTFAKIAERFSKFGIIFETCAEPELAAINSCFVSTGCVGETDLKLMGLAVPTNTSINPQNRGGCRCLACKTELLENKKRCPYQCAYCYWKDN